MKMLKGIAIALTMSPMMALACPDLGGNYLCQYKGFKKALTVTQSKVNGVTVFQVDNGGDIYADGQPHQTNNLHPLLDQYATNYNYTARCAGQNVNVDGTADMKNGSGQATVKGSLMQQGTDLSIGMTLTTSSRTTNLTLACAKQ